MNFKFKGLYFYDYADSFERFNETEVPKPEHFYNTLDDKSISEKDYNHVLNVWKEMKIKNKGEYHDLYLKKKENIIIYPQFLYNEKINVKIY